MDSSLLCGLCSGMQGLYQMFWLFLILYGAPAVLPGYELPSRGSTDPGYLSYAGVMVTRIDSRFNLKGDSAMLGRAHLLSIPLATHRSGSSHSVRLADIAK